MKAEILAVFFVASLAILPGIVRGDDLPDASLGIDSDSVELTLPLMSALNTRFEVRSLRFGNPLFAADGRLDLRSYGALLDLYPLKHGPRISAGLIDNGSRIGLRATCPSTCGIGNVWRPGDRRYKKAKPYLGLGYGDSLGAWPLSFGFDVGVLLQNQLRNSFDANSGHGQTATGQGLGDADSLAGNFAYNPVVQFSLGWRF